ncbi:Tripartite-type tricarboxylate transporter, receptor component TctC [Blastococcus aggregatus]|uniref:Tripartite-type tricarboxylate transporter, receptor component TctC n=1 Tax=Blastococcus aggregatus TaxID=38502 RepID=A0A285V6E9_9ACTN|nr:tripartite tricarboxylate transporter substrate-binding protein [Blastococcus aggregatus]SOC49507.1 Tripartite-type tricarboxylate transporter, receptor component TctC [Blastococcus aggregatus]
MTHRPLTALRRAGGAAVLVAALAACGQDGETSGDGAEANFYEGENLDFVVPYDAGGGYDVYARAIAPYLGECLGAEVVVRNEPGAGSLLATNATAAAGPEDRRIQITNSVGTTSAQIAGAEGVMFDMSEFSMIGRLATAPDTVAVAADSDLEDFQDIIDSEETVRFVATGPGSNEYIAASVLSAIYGFPYEVITGFGGSGEARLAVIAGNADAHASTWDSHLGAIESGELNPVLVTSDEPVELLPDTPVLTDFTPESEEGQVLVEDLVNLETLGRGLVAPPGLPENQLTELREAFECATTNEELIAELEGQQRPLDVLNGDEYLELIESVIDSSPEFIEAVKASF